MKNTAIAIGLIVLFSGFASADSLTFTTSSCQGNNDLLNTLTNLPNCIVESLFTYIISGLISSIQGFIDASFKFLFSMPNLTWFCGSYNTVMALIETLYSIALMGLAMLFIVRANDVEGRLAAKKWLENMLIMIILLSFSFALFQLLADFNSYLSSSLASDSMKDIFTPSANLTSAIFSLIILLLVTVLLVITFITLLIRYLLIPFLLLLFPIAIFLYFVPLTQSWGKSVLRAIAMILFMTSIDALVLMGLSSLFTASDPNLTDTLVRAFAVLFGFGALGIINALLLLSAILSVVSQSKALSSVVGVTVLSKVMKKR